MTADSGAADHVVPVSVGSGFEVEPSAGSKTGLHYRSANGGRIPNLGQKRLKGYSDEGSPISWTPQVAAVTKSLNSLVKTCKAGNRVVLDTEKGSYIENKKTGAKTQLRVEKEVFVFDLWFKKGKGSGSKEKEVSTVAKEEQDFQRLGEVIGLSR